MQIDALWKKIMSSLEDTLDEKTIAAWFQNVRLKSASQDTIIIETPNNFTSRWIKNNYRNHLVRAAEELSGKKVKLIFEQNPELEESAGERVTAPAKAPAKEKERISAKKLAEYEKSGLNPKYTFDNFVVGGSNQFAHAACLAVAEKQAKNYNPLFIYGGVGLGKTHLLNAVGNEIFARPGRKRVICIQAEKFMNEMIQAIREEKMDSFRKKYRKECDFLLMDDIEILAGKERTQEEFFYTFNELYSAGKTIVITSDKFPKEMTTLEERLRSRFESGIIVDIQAPEYETRLAILRYKAEQDLIALPDEVAHFLAEKISSNIRKLEGSLIRLSALASLSGSPVTIELAENVIRAILDDEHHRLNADNVMKTVALYFKVKVSDLKSPKRNRKYAVPRQIAMYLCREMCSMSYPEIGSAFGGRDHSTVIHSCRKIGIEKNTDYELKKHLDNLQAKLQGG